ncbi:MAG: arginine--tRNA ligase [Corallococcus sp.]|nr:arginine--tRNA ligase [Corallococcus sp.]
MINYKKYIADLIDIIGVDKNEVCALVTKTADENKGDYSLPCFRLAKVLRKSPQQIAAELAQSIAADKFIERAEAVNGYLNVFLKKSAAVCDIVFDINAKGDDYGKSDEGKDKTICIDYSSVNIAKSLHIGHLGTTAIGSSLYKIFCSLGYSVVGINHLGDYGTQFGKMIVAYKLWGDDEKIRKGGAKALQEIYVKYHQEAEKNPALDDEARAWFAKIERGDEEALRLFEYFKEITLADVKKIYDRLNVKFDSWNGESFYNDKMDKPLKLLEEKGLITESQGAKVVDLSDYGMPPCLLVKSDGSSLYATRDIAAAFYRKETYNFDKCLYVVAYQQNLHFKQIFKTLELAGMPWAKDMVHVAYGMVSLEEGAMSTRKGNTVFLEDVLNKAVEKSLDVIRAKNPDLHNKEQIAEQIGVGAVIFSAVENARIKDITFTFDRVLNFDGETAPYLQYTHARCRSILKKAGMSRLCKIMPDYRVFDNAETMSLAKLLGDFPRAVHESAEKYEPCVIAKYLIDVAQSFNKFYFAHRVLSDNIAEQNARLEVVSATATVLKNGLKLLGIDAPEQM